MVEKKAKFSFTSSRFRTAVFASRSSNSDLTKVTECSRNAALFPLFSDTHTTIALTFSDRANLLLKPLRLCRELRCERELMCSRLAAFPHDSLHPWSVFTENCSLLKRFQHACKSPSPMEKLEHVQFACSRESIATLL